MNEEEIFQLQVGVKILLKNNEEKYLLLYRSEEKYPEVKGRWDLVGGRIDPEKSLRENLRREMKEETGLELSGLVRLVAAQDIFRPDKHIVRLTYRGEAEGEVRLDPQEHNAFRWYTWEELCALEYVDEYFKILLDDSVSSQKLK